MSGQQFSFGSGALWAERIDVTGSGIGPRQFGVLQSANVDITFTEKELYGTLQFPVAIARGTGKISGKAKVAEINGLLFSDIFFGQSATTGQFAVSQYEPATVPVITPFTVTVANAASYVDDLGVINAVNGNRFNRVTTPSAAGQYTVNFATGVYTFSAADAGAAIVLSYTYNITTSGTRSTIINQPLGTTPTFKTTLYQQVSPGAPGSGVSSKPWSLRLNACTSSKFTLPTTLDNWTLMDFDFNAFADASGTIGWLSTVNI
jgi:hypothetical protein